MKKIFSMFLLFIFVVGIPIKCFAEQPRDAEEVLMGVDFDFPPYRMDSNYGLIGFNVSLNDLIFKDSKYKVTYTYVELDKLGHAELIAAKKENPEVRSFGWRVINDVTKTNLLVSDPLPILEWGAFTLEGKNDTFNNLDDLKKQHLKVGVVGYKYGYTQIKGLGITPIKYDHLGSAIDALRNEEIDVLYDEKNSINYVALYNGYLKQLHYHENTTKNIPTGLTLTNKNDTELLAFVNKRVKELSGSEEYENLYMNFFLKHSNEYIQKQNLKRTYTISATSIIIILILIAYFIIHHRILGKQLVRQQNLFNTLLQNGNSMSIIWKSDLSKLEFNTYMETQIDQEITPLDKTFMQQLFGSLGNNDAGIASILNEESQTHLIQMKNGKKYYILFNTVIVEQSKNTTVLLSVGTDVTEMMDLKQELLDKNYDLTIAEERYNLALEGADAGIIMFELGETVTFYISENARKLFGFDEDRDMTIVDIDAKAHPDDYHAHMHLFNQLLKGEINSFASESRFLVDEIYHYFLFRFKNVLDEQGNVFRITGVFFDVTAQKEMGELVNKRTFEDELTGLPNRRKFLIEGEKIISQAETINQELSLIYFDLNDFQMMNNLIGYDYGDEVLKDVAKVTLELTGKHMLFARLGSDDFVILAPCKGRMDVEIFVDKLNETVATMDTADKFKMSISVGVSLSQHKKDILTMLSEATMALGVIKSTSQEILRFYDEDTKKISIERELLKKDLLTAYEEKQFVLYYQPKFSFANQNLIGMEALIRWIHPTKGLISPFHFIPLAEEMGMITKIDEWVMLEACRQNKQWQTEGFPAIKISVNVSQAQFYQTDIIKTIKGTLHETNLSPKYLEIELTETMAMQDIQKTIAMLSRIKELGIGISMDDFGTGYSSLNSLKMIPIDTLKIDRSLIMDVETNETARNIISAIISLAKSMKLVTVAEGVETDEQRIYLQQIGCDVAQGYYFGKPEPSEKFVEFYK